MKKTAVITAFMLMGLAGSSYAIPGESVGTTLAVKAQTAMQQVKFRLLQLEIVKNGKILMDNYIQSKKYYDAIAEASRNRGGLLGYYRDRFAERLGAAAREEWWALQQLKSGSDDNAVRRLVEGGEAAVNRQVDKTADRWIANMDTELEQMVEVVNESTDRSRKRDQVLKQLARDAGEPGISDKKYDSLQLQASLLQLEYLSAIEKQNQALFAGEVRAAQREQILRKRNQEVAKSLSSSLGASAGRSRKTRQGGTVTIDQAIRVLGEKPR